MKEKTKIQAKHELTAPRCATAGRSLALAALTLVASACSDASDDSDNSGQREGPLYVVSHSIYTDDGATSYLTVVDSLGPGHEVDLSRSLEFGGGARAYGPEGSDIVYVTSSERGTMTEVEFDPDGTPRIGRSVSFENLGISGTTGGNVHLFVSPSKAYFVSQNALEVVVWNPRDMEIVTTIPLELQAHLASPDGGFFFYPRPIVVGDHLLLVANRSGDEFDEGSVLSVVDTTDDRLVSTTLEPRCHGMLQSAVDSAGDRYFASSDFSAAEHFLFPDQAPAPCMLRIRAGEVAFDADWSRTLTSDLDTRLWTGITPGPGGRMYSQSIREQAKQVVAAAADQEPFQVKIAQPWEWHALTDGDADPIAVETDFLRTPLGFTAIDVDGKAYGGLGGEVETTLVDLSSSDTPEPGLVVPGYVFNIVRIR